MNKKCIGCGAVLQSLSKDEPGYIENILDDKAICKRCFRLKNYGEFISYNTNNDNFLKIVNEIKTKKNLILFLCDILNLDETLSYLNYLKSDVVLVITKKDIIPKSVKDIKIINYIKENYNFNLKKIFFISSIKNYNIDELYNYILKNNYGKDVYILGNTNVGKSTFINSFIKSYSNDKSYVTSSIMPATTIDLIKIKINDKLTLIDTPGIIYDDSYLNKLDPSSLKKILPKKEIKPKTYQIRPKQSLLIGDYVRLDYLSSYNNSITVYVSNDLNVTRINQETNSSLKEKHSKKIHVKNRNDIVISTLGFIKIINECDVMIYLKDDVKILLRRNLI